jgi:hypothetical protein
VLVAAQLVVLVAWDEELDEVSERATRSRDFEAIFNRMMGKVKHALAREAKGLQTDHRDERKKKRSEDIGRSLCRAEGTLEEERQGRGTPS